MPAPELLFIEPHIPLPAGKAREELPAETRSTATSIPPEHCRREPEAPGHLQRSDCPEPSRSRRTNGDIQTVWPSIDFDPHASCSLLSHDSLHRRTDLLRTTFPSAPPSTAPASNADLEGIAPGDDGIYFVSSSGGEARRGQVFHYLPTSAAAGELRLVFESPSRDILDSPDNMVLSPEGGLVLCEDGSGEQFIRELDGEGRIANLVRSRPDASEFAGACFSPDGRVLFFNVYGSQDPEDPAATYALW